VGHTVAEQQGYTQHPAQSLSRSTNPKVPLATSLPTTVSLKRSTCLLEFVRCDLRCVIVISEKKPTLSARTLPRSE